jgi:BirA family biotin operon repressor/biotin-[acetyl-CoA-carboxylase] ligase
MLVYTDSIDFAVRLLRCDAAGWASLELGQAPAARELHRHLFSGRPVWHAELPSALRWSDLFLVAEAPRSQFDLLVALSGRESALPDGCLCLADTGRDFHGFKGRHWSTAPGNIHLSAYLAPAQPVIPSGTAFMVLATVSLVDAIDAASGLEGKSAIKWPNDILVDGAKVGGVLAHTQSRGDRVTAAVVGIGLNVETSPAVEPTPFVPRVSSLRDIAPGQEVLSQGDAFARLSEALDRNYELLMRGGYDRLLERYRARSVVVGRRVAVCTEQSGAGPQVIAEGVVTRLGDHLELYLEGQERPFTKGRLMLSEG